MEYAQIPRWMPTPCRVESKIIPLAGLMDAMTKGRPTATQRGYGSAWAKAKAAHLLSHPNCVMCAEHGRQTKATVVDHITPHRGDQALFWDRSNWQSLCTTHHNGPKQRMERTGRQIGCDVDGWPLQ